MTNRITARWDRPFRLSSGRTADFSAAHLAGKPASNGSTYAAFISVDSRSLSRCAGVDSDSNHSPRRSTSGGGYRVALLRTDSGASSRAARLAVAVWVALTI